MLTEVPNFWSNFAALEFDPCYYQLREVHLNHNIITSLSCKHLPYCLTLIDLFFNSLTHLGDISHCSWLKELNLNGNPLVSIEGLPQKLQILGIDLNIESVSKNISSVC